MTIAVSYSKLWKLLIDRRIRKPELKASAHISPGTYAKLNNDQFVSMEVMARICDELQCDIGDVMEFVAKKPEKQQEWCCDGENK